MVAVIPTKVAQVINFIIITMNVLYYLFAMCCMLYDIIYWYTWVYVMITSCYVIPYPVLHLLM